MLTLYLNSNTREWFDSNGNPLADGQPTLTFGTSEAITINVRKQTPGAGELGVDVNSWQIQPMLDVQYAKLTIDSDYIHKLKGTLAESYTAGAANSIVITMPGVKSSLISQRGILRLFSSDGDYESVRYADISVSGGAVNFVLEDGAVLLHDHTAGSQVDCDQSPYCSAFHVADDSDPLHGKWVFLLQIDSQRLRDEFDYSNKASIDIHGMEVLFYKNNSGIDIPRYAYLLDTASLRNTLGTVGSEAPVPDPLVNEITATINGVVTPVMNDIKEELKQELQDYVQTELANKAW